MKSEIKYEEILKVKILRIFELNSRFIKLFIYFFAFIFLIIPLKSQQSDKLYLAPPMGFTPQINKYLFYQPQDYNGTVIAQTAPKEVAPRINYRISQDSTEENNVEVIYDKNGGPYQLNVKLKIKEKDKKITINIYNLLGNKVSDIWEGVTGQTETSFDLIEPTKSLSNGIYICVVQAANLRLIKKFTISR